MKIILLVGCSGSGKSSLISAFEGLPTESGVATVRLGKILTAKYPLSHFKGQAAPDHTQDEAWEIVQDHVGKAFVSGARLCVVDSFPRKEFQVDDIMRRWPNDARFVHLYCDEKVRTDRLTFRDKSDPVKWEHTLLRIENEESEVYRVLCSIYSEKSVSMFCNTEKLALDDYGKLASDLTKGIEA